MRLQGRSIARQAIPVLECPNCGQYLIADREFSRVEQMLAQVNGAAELEILRYVA